MDRGAISVFSLNSGRGFGERVASALGTSLSAHEERDFEDGEHKSRPLVSVRGRDVFVVQSLQGEPGQSVNDKLCRLLFFLGALVDASAERVTAVIPYLCYARKDRKTKPRDPVTTRYVARLFEAVGVDRVVTLDVHNLAAYQNAFRCRSDHLEARNLFAAHFAARLKGDETAVVSPDIGGVKRADRFREALEAATGKPVSSAFMEKQRSAGVVSGEAFVGDVQGRAAIIIDDLISTGTTMRRAAVACRNAGATAVYAAATHGAFSSEAGRVLDDSSFDGIVVTDTVAPFGLAPELQRSRLVTIDTAGLFAAAIERVRSGGSLTDLLEI